MLAGRILVPIDFSKGSERALGYAIELAKTLDASVHTVTIWQPDDQLPLDLPIWSADGSAARTLADTARAGAMARLRQLLAGVDQNGITPIEARVEVGEPSEVIVQLAESGHYDLIVMSPIGYQSRFMPILGSITGRVLCSSAVPVTTIARTC